MNKRTAPVLVIAGLVAGLVLGSLTVAGAAPTVDEATGEPLGVGARMGLAIRDAGARMIDIVSDLTGLETDEIYERRVAGESVADIAESEGVDAATVVDEALAAREAILDQKVADGTIDEATKAAMLDRMGDRLTERIESTEPGPFGRGGRGGGGCGGAGGGRGPGGPGGCGGGACGVAPTADDPVSF